MENLFDLTETELLDHLKYLTLIRDTNVYHKSPTAQTAIDNVELWIEEIQKWEDHHDIIIY